MSEYVAKKKKKKKKKKMKPAAKFLLVILAGILLTLAGAMTLYLNPVLMLNLAFKPGHSFADGTSDPQPDYADNRSWLALPGVKSNASAMPAGLAKVLSMPEVDVFFVHPTTYFGRDNWNAPIADHEANERTEARVLKIQASVFNNAGQIYAPRYRQATFGAFFDKDGDGEKALDLAYTDVLASFDNFIAQRSAGRPFILAGHSQGSYHLISLLQDRITGTELQRRMVSAYIIGWPVSIEADLGALADIDACRSPAETGCVVSYQTFGKEGDPFMLDGYMEFTTGLTGEPRKGTEMLCTNPLNWQIGTSEVASNHLGAVFTPPNPDTLPAPILEFNGGQCRADGVLHLTKETGSAWNDLKMAGENYHAYDYNMFYMNIRENAAMRASAWLNANRALATATGR
ncbi:MAG: hypothetical protein COB37_03485 [Kordiimonadales bacterium]|nr:MAG: hypothetical protein COB37_03485 [Kordiimonadales bacterium]